MLRDKNIFFNIYSFFSLQHSSPKNQEILVKGKLMRRVLIYTEWLIFYIFFFSIHGYLFLFSENRKDSVAQKKGGLAKVNPKKLYFSPGWWCDVFEELNLYTLILQNYPHHWPYPLWRRIKK